MEDVADGHDALDLLRGTSPSGSSSTSSEEVFVHEPRDGTASSFAWGILSVGVRALEGVEEDEVEEEDVDVFVLFKANNLWSDASWMTLDAAYWYEEYVSSTFFVVLFL